MKELKELGFEYMPTLNEFVKKKYSLLVIANKDCKGWDFSPSDFENTLKYANLIDQQPKLGDFIPCIDGVPVDEPKFFYNSNSLSKLKGADLDFALSVNEKVRQYEKALEQVKFECKKELGTYWVDGEHHQSMVNTVCRYKTYEQAINDGVKFKIK